MSPHDQKTATPDPDMPSVADGRNRPYTRPRLRWLGDVNAITLFGTGVSDGGSRKKPNG